MAERMETGVEKAVRDLAMDRERIGELYGSAQNEIERLRAGWTVAERERNTAQAQRDNAARKFQMAENERNAARDRADNATEENTDLHTRLGELQAMAEVERSKARAAEDEILAIGERMVGRRVAAEQQLDRYRTALVRIAGGYVVGNSEALAKALRSMAAEALAQPAEGERFGARIDESYVNKSEGVCVIYGTGQACKFLGRDGAWHGYIDNSNRGNCYWLTRDAARTALAVAPDPRGKEAEPAKAEPGSVSPKVRMYSYRIDMVPMVVRVEIY